MINGIVEATAGRIGGGIADNSRTVRGLCYLCSGIFGGLALRMRIGWEAAISMRQISTPRDFIPVRIAILAVSDTRRLAQDTSGGVLATRLTAAGHILAARAILPDERNQIAARLRDWCADPEIDVILTTGGTGLTGRDVTVEAHRDVYEKEIEAFATVFTHVSMQKIGTSAVQSRATGGVAQNTLLFALPGSSGACKDAWDEILVHQLDYRHRPCNFVELFPRLGEHRQRK